MTQLEHIMRVLGALRMRMPFPRLLAMIAAVTVVGCASPGPAPVHYSERVPVDGARLYMEVRGEDRNAPVLLWLHGGPGGAERPLFRYFNGALEKHFVVAYLDQRGAGLSYDPDADTSRLTVAQHLADLDVVVDRLRSSLKQDKVILVGHSWGTVLGLLYTAAHPVKVAAYIGVSQVVATKPQQALEYAWDRQQAVAHGDKSALKKLGDIGAPPYDDSRDVLALGNITNRFTDPDVHEPNQMGVALAGIARGLIAPWDIGKLIQANNVSLAAMNRELQTLDLRRSVKSVNVPVFFFLGRHDHHVDARLAADYFDTLTAPSKHLVWFEHSAHNIPFEEPAAFNEAVVTAMNMTPGVRPD
ncbi:MAG: alpha/beta fold hydrolase [Alphaproteobacteria bacterium]|nr:alpha/beta fold hydrolase [Alphaproteobacteria bacterium]